MLIYYSGFDKEGEKFHRFDDVPDIDDIYDALEKNNEELLQLIELPPVFDAVGKVGTKKLKNKEVIEFCHHLSTYLDGGVDLATIFKDIQLESNSKAMKKAIKKISASLTEGDSLSEAFEQTKVLPEILVILIGIGEKSGDISRALKDAAMYLEREMSLRSSTYRALIYPVFTLTIMFIGLVVWVVYVIPQVVTLIQDMDVELPIQTRLLIDLSDFVQEYWVFELLFVFCLLAIFIGGRYFSLSRYYLDKLWWYMPITGKVVVSSQMAFYFNYFKVLYDAGVSVSDILIRLQKSASSHYFRKQISISNDSIKEGDTLQRGYEKAKVFEAIAVRIIGVGEQAGNIEKQLDLLSKNYHKRVQVFVETLPKVLEPVFISIIGILFVLFASTLLGPLYEVIVKLGVNI